MRRLIIAFFVLALFSSCHKEEIPIEPFDRGDMISAEIDMGNAYVNRVFFNLTNTSIEGSIEKEDWDVAFSADTDHVILNDGRLMAAWKSPFYELHAANDSSGFGQGKEIEVAAELLDDPAIDELDGVYLLDLGFTGFGLPMGMVWLKFEEVSASTYLIAYKRFGDSEIKQAIINRDGSNGYLYFSFAENSIMTTPPGSSWDIIFTKYTHQFDDPPIAYLVTGVLLNLNRTVAAEYSEKPFENISAADTAMVEWSNRPDLIGYDWKTYSFDTGTYVVATDRTWLIRTTEGFYFKLRFTDFYDENGNVGVPQFEYQLL
jgi:hypothetical protein